MEVYQARSIGVDQMKTQTARATTPLPPAPEVSVLPAENQAPAPVKAKTDVLAVRAGGGVTENKQRVLEGRANFDTGKAELGKTGQPELNKTLDAVVATLKTMPADKRAALLADPNFKIEIEGNASNLGTASKFDNVGLSRRRAESTAAYVTGYLKERGIEVPSTAVKTTGTGAPGARKPADDNDQADRTAAVKVTLPGLDPLPQSTPQPTTPTNTGTTTTPTNTGTTTTPTNTGTTTTPTNTGTTTTPTNTGTTVTPINTGTTTTPTQPSATEKALADFNATVLPVAEMLTKGKASTTTLAERTAIVAQAQASLQKAEGLLPQLDPNAQLGAQALINSYKDQVGVLGELAGRQQAELTKGQADIAADLEKLGQAGGAKSKKGLKQLIDQLQEKYKDPASLGKDLPEDARKTLQTQAGALMKEVTLAIARNCDNSDIDRTDNSYLFGRPGPKFKENWEALAAFMQATPPTEEQKQNAVKQLGAMAEAVKDFDDPQTKKATQSVYDELSRAVFAKLAA